MLIVCYSYYCLCDLIVDIFVLDVCLRVLLALRDYVVWVDCYLIVWYFAYWLIYLWLIVLMLMVYYFGLLVGCVWTWLMRWLFYLTLFFIA